MSLPVRQRRMLGRIERSLRGSDPRLTALYAIFSRLTAGEELPRIEQLRHGAVVMIARARARLVYVLGRIFGRILPRQRAVLFFPLTLALVAVAIVFAARSGSGRGCPPSSPLATSSHRPLSKACKSIPVDPFLIPH